MKIKILVLPAEASDRSSLWLDEKIPSIKDGLEWVRYRRKPGRVHTSEQGPISWEGMS